MKRSRMAHHAICKQTRGRKALKNFGTRHRFAWMCAFALCSLLTTFSVAWAQQQNGAEPKKLNPYTGNAEAIAEGQKLYKLWNCYGCHGMQGGGGMGPNLTDEKWQTGDGSDSNLLEQIRNGKGNMPPFKAFLSDDQVWKLIAFVRTLYKGDSAKVKW
ncbi:MAG: cytochrome c [Candidatus Binatia bacterium]